MSPVPFVFIKNHQTPCPSRERFSRTNRRPSTQMCSETNCGLVIQFCHCFGRDENRMFHSCRRTVYGVWVVLENAILIESALVFPVDAALIGKVESTYV